MADAFSDQLRAELDGIEVELERLATRRRLIEELLSLESTAAAPRRTAHPTAAAARRPRLPRGLIAGKIREFLGSQHEPAHATQILAYLEQHEAAPRSAKPMKTLQSALQRLKEQGEVENTGRNHWRLRQPEPAAEPATSASTPALPDGGPPVVTSTTRFGSHPGART